MHLDQEVAADLWPPRRCALARVGIAVLVSVAATVAQPASAQEPVYFRQTWCPTADEVAQLERSWTLTRSGCCVFKATPVGDRASALASLAPFASRLSVEQDLGACVPVADSQMAEAVRLEEATRRQEVVNSRVRVAQMVQELPQMEDAELCAQLGRHVRATESDGMFPGYRQALRVEAARRRLRVNTILMAAERLGLGDSVCQMYAAWGDPDTASVTVTMSSVEAVYYYAGSNAVYASNGTVTAIQRRR